MIHSTTDRTNAGWLDSNCLRDYPVTEPSILPYSLLADVFIVACVAEGKVCISSVTVSEAIVSVWFALEGDSEVLGVASAPLSRTGFTSVNIQSPNGTMHGSAVFGDPSSARTMGRGSKSFSGGLPLHARTFIAAGRNLLSSLAVSGRIGTLTGRIELAAPFPMAVVSDTETNSLILTLAGNDHLVLADCQNTHSSPDCGCLAAITSINGVEPDEDGNITLIVQSDPSGIVEASIKNLEGRLVIETSGDRDRFCVRTPVLPDEWGRVAGTDDQNPPTNDYLLRYPDALDLPTDSPAATEYPECLPPPE